ncbi:MAG: translation initiation factor IF-2 [Candidatus Woesearchaeota archaeon]
MKALRCPICVVVGHVDHGKSSILDYVRGTNIVAKEAGAITQAIGASKVPLDYLKKVCGPLLKSQNVSIPGLLFIDTPGHAAFTSMRQRGGSLADIAILVVNINEGIKPQTLEALKILREQKTPFVVAANKIDLIDGYQSNPKTPFIQNMQQQSEKVMTLFEQKLYDLVGFFYEQGLKAERFDRVSDFTQEIAIIPTSAKKGDGMSELFMVITLLAQKYLEQKLLVSVDGPAKGTIVEVKEQQGLGTVLDTIVYDGTLHVNDVIVIGHTQEPIIAKVKALFTPCSVADMRDKKTTFAANKTIAAACGVRIAAVGIDQAIAGMPFEAVGQQEVEQVSERLQKTISDITFESEKEGIIVKADTLGGVEALLTLLKEHDIPVRKALVGEISKKDIMQAESAKHPVHRVILGFNIKRCEASITLFCYPVIYQIIDEYVAWKTALEQQEQQATLDGLPKPCKIEYMKNHTFRQSHPAIIGITVVEGTLKKGTYLMHEGQPIGAVRAVQLNGEQVHQAVKNDQVAISIEGVIAGRHIKEGDVYYSSIDEESFRQLKEKKDLLRPDEIEALKDIATLMRKQNPVWGM